MLVMTLKIPDGAKIEMSQALEQSASEAHEVFVDKSAALAADLERLKGVAVSMRECLQQLVSGLGVPDGFVMTADAMGKVKDVLAQTEWLNGS
jgi:hypothetical protein